MRVRPFIPVLILVVAFVPMAASAAIPEPFIYSSQFIGLPPIPGTSYGTLQTAMRAWDSPTLRVLVHSVYNPMPTLAADLSALGLSASATTTGVWIGYGAPYYPGYEYDFGPLAIGANIPDGMKEIPLTATDANSNVATATARIVVDNAPPTVSISSITFSTTSPNEGDYLYLSGKIDGTGSQARASSLLLSLTDAGGHPVVSSVLGGSMIYYGVDALNAALVTSTDGSFSNIPVRLISFGDKNWFPRADNLSIKIAVYDEAGNTASTTLTVPIHPPSPTPAPKVSNVLFIPGTEASRLYWRDALGIERQLWEPSIWTDIPKLAMNANGTSINRVYTKDVIDSIYGNLGLGQTGHLNPSNLEVYGDFARFMDGLVASSTVGLKKWAAYPYDWRYDVRDIVDQGTLTEQPDGALTRVYIEDVLNKLASSSATSKVTIVAHSNGGLLAKALLAKLATEGRVSEVDQLIMIGTPQWGTPVDIGAMLHGDGQSHGLGIIAYADDVRRAAATMPGPYNLLPSPTYFAHVADPVATFATDDVAGPFHTHFPNGITSFTDLTSFITDAFGLDASVGVASNLNVPLALSSSLVAKAAATHAALDAWMPPSGLKVISIAGWGQLTTYSYRYASSPGHLRCESIFGQGLVCSRTNQLVHTPQKTEDGDDTVVSPSAVGNVGQVWYFNAQRFKADKLGNIVHSDITSASPIQNTITDLLEGKTISENYIGTFKPVGKNPPLTIIGGMSPINILATDVAGEETGIVPIPGTTGLYFAKHDIPGSAVDVSGEEKFVTLPAGLTYSLVATGYNSGPANILVEQVGADGVVTASTTIADIPVTASTTIALSLGASGAPSVVAIDFNGDGVTDVTIMPAAGALTSFTTAVSPPDYIAYMKRIISGMSLDQEVATTLLAKLSAIARAPRGASAAAQLNALESWVHQQADRASRPGAGNAQKGISIDNAAQILAMITELRLLILHP